MPEHEMATATGGAPSLRVADAPSLGVRAKAVTSESKDDGSIVYAKGLRRVSYTVLLIMTLVHFSTFMVLDGLGFIVRILVIARYLLWPTIIVALIAHLNLHGPGALLNALLPVGTFFLCGLVSALIGAMPGESLRLLTFWLFGVIAAAVLGQELAPRVIYQTLFFCFFIGTVASVAFSVTVPSIGTSLDGRLHEGVWRGLFPGKNFFGLFCVYAFLFSLTAPGIPKSLRIIQILFAIIALKFAVSQGAVMVALGSGVFVFCMPALLAQCWPVPAKSLLLTVLIVAAAIAIIVGMGPMLELLGRDPSLTGRSDVWPMWLKRASDNWLLGTGPGSFTTIDSPVVGDLSAIFAYLGTIHSPHNMFIAVFGETGILGLLAFVIPLFYMIAILPFRYPSWLGLATAAIAFTMVTGGISETREVFGLGMNMFLLLLSYSALSALTRKSEEASADQLRVVG